MTGQLNGHFFMCTETSPRCYVIQKLDSSTITQKTLSNVAKNIPQNLGNNDQYSSNSSNPPFPNLPYWYNAEIEKNLIGVSEGLPPTSHYVYPNNNNVSSVPNIQVTEDSGNVMKYGPEKDNLLQVDKNLTDQKSETSGEEDNGTRELEDKLRGQLEYYFSRENLSTDKYLKGQMDSEGYVQIKILANFRKISALTNDINIIIDAIKKSNILQVDKNNEKVRVSAKRSTLILREISETDGEDMVKELLKNGPEWKRICYASNNSWYVTYDDDESCGKACLEIQEQAKKLGKDISVRIKTGGVPIHENHHSSSSNVSTVTTGNMINNGNNFMNNNNSINYLNPLSIIPYGENFVVPHQCQNYSPVQLNNYEGMNYYKNCNKESFINGLGCFTSSTSRKNFISKNSISPRRLSPSSKNNYGKKQNSLSFPTQIEKMDLGPILTLSGFYPTAAYKPSPEGLREIPLPPNPNLFMNSGQQYRNNKNSTNMTSSHSTINVNSKKTINENNYGKRNNNNYKVSQHYNSTPENTKINNNNGFQKYGNISNLHQNNSFSPSEYKNNNHYGNHIVNNNKSTSLAFNNTKYVGKNFNPSYNSTTVEGGNKKVYRYSNESNSSSSSSNFTKVTLFNNGYRGPTNNTTTNFKVKGINNGNGIKKYNTGYDKNLGINRNKNSESNDESDDGKEKNIIPKIDEDCNKIYWKIKDTAKKVNICEGNNDDNKRGDEQNNLHSDTQTNDVDLFKIPGKNDKETFIFDEPKVRENNLPSNINDKNNIIIERKISSKSNDTTTITKISQQQPKCQPKYNFNEGEFPVLCEVTDKMGTSLGINSNNNRKNSSSDYGTLQFSDIAAGKSRNPTQSTDENFDECNKNTVMRKSYAETLLVDKN
uniref:HTH La-type RNA-binding domain-containing protein n=1 Tax=Parastrongyloides trichosuri TaxID=131310 RepID=A0A0N5A1F9_PARTI